jgi:TonB-dependent SusC/RagA subfamily outer membrane receptor
MKKFKSSFDWGILSSNALKILMFMKLTTFFLMISALSVWATETYSQSKKLTIDLKETTVEDVLSKIEAQSEFYFLYSEKVIDAKRKVSLDMKEEKIETILTQLFNGTDVTYTIKDRIIVLSTPEVLDNMTLAAWQQATITGTVTDTRNQPLPGVTVVIKGTTQGTITDADGKYSLLNVKSESVLQFSFVGMKTQEVVVGSQTTINVKLEDETIGIEEVVAVGYGTLQRNRISTSIASINPEKVKVQVTSSIDRSLEGQIAGLNVRQTTGAPGGGSEMTIRGAGSIGAGNQPLVVIDGIPMQNIYGKERSPLALLNQADIAAIDVLKGVSATSIYGSRGSNGVILITTNSGKEGKTEFSFSARVGFDQILEMEKHD